MGANESVIGYLELNKPFQLIIQVYPYFHNYKNNEHSVDYGYLLLSEFEKFKKYLFEIIYKTSHICKHRCFVNPDNIFLTLEKDHNNYEYIIIEMIMKVCDELEKPMELSWNSIFFPEEEKTINAEIIKQSIIVAIHQTRESLHLKDDIFFCFQENDIIDFRICQE